MACGTQNLLRGPLFLDRYPERCRCRSNRDSSLPLASYYSFPEDLGVYYRGGYFGPGSDLTKLLILKNKHVKLSSNLDDAGHVLFFFCESNAVNVNDSLLLNIGCSLF